jgi:hypothetical protein
MWLTNRQVWLLIHLGLGALYLHGFGLGLFGLTRPHPRPRLIAWGAGLVAVAALASVLTGTWLLYPWYRAAVPPGADVAASPKAWLLAQTHLTAWHTFGMEWKEHLAWLSPICATAVASVTVRYRHHVVAMPETHGMLRVLLVLAFVSGLIPGLLGGALNKVAPNLFLLY